MRVLVEGQLVPLAAWPMQLQGSCGVVWMAPLAVTPCAWSRVSEQGGPRLVPVLLTIFDPADDHRAGRAEGKNTSHFQWSPPVSSHREVSKSVFTLSLLISLLAFSLQVIPHKTSSSLPTQPFLQWEHEWKWSNNPHLGYSCGKTTSPSYEFGYNHIFILASYLKHKRKCLFSAQLWYLRLYSSQGVPDKDSVFFH